MSRHNALSWENTVQYKIVENYSSQNSRETILHLPGVLKIKHELQELGKPFFITILIDLFKRINKQMKETINK